MNIRPAATLTLVATVTLWSCTAPELVIENAWIRTPPPGLNMTAAYLELKNNTTKTVTLVGAASAAYASVTLHESRLIDGVWKMTALPSIPIAAGKQLSLTPGGLHLMMSEPVQTVVPGEQTTIRLEFADGQLITVPAIVQDSAP